MIEGTTQVIVARPDGSTSVIAAPLQVIFAFGVLLAGRVFDRVHGRIKGHDGSRFAGCGGGSGHRGMGGRENERLLGGGFFGHGFWGGWEQ